MSGASDLFAGVHNVDRFRPPNALAEAATRYHISPRQARLLALDGSSLGEVSEKLNITSSPVQGHIKSMLDECESRNRSELIPRVLEMERYAHSPCEQVFHKRRQGTIPEFNDCNAQNAL